MKLYLKNPFVLMLICLLTGMFITVSFLETPLKFQVSGITLSIALGLGKIMFGISTKIQGAFLILILALMFFARRDYTKLDFLIVILILLVLIVQQFWMLPVLNERADQLSAGKPVPSSELHNFFIYTEVGKMILLLLVIILQFKTQQNNGY